MTPYYSDDLVTLHAGDCLDVLGSLPDASVDAVVTDPPYGLEFMGKEWDGADGFRRSLNPNDAGRDNAFGRTSRTSPEYRTKPVGKVSKIGEADGSPHRRNTGTPSWGASGNPVCRNCGGTKYDRTRPNGCSCDSPDFPNHMAGQMHTFQQWCEAWATECLRVLKPGGHMLAFGGTRTWHRLACAVEDAGFEVRDSIAWLYGSGFPKSLDVTRAIDAHQKHGGSSSIQKRRASMGDSYEPSEVFGQFRTGHIDTMNTPRSTAPKQVGERTPDAERWQGWGTALKPAFEPVVVARKPLAGTVAANVLAHGTGALNIDACRICGEGMDGWHRDARDDHELSHGRWPANVVLDESQAAALDEQSGELTSGVMRAGTKPKGERETYGQDAAAGYETQRDTPGDSGGASRFFYVAKADASERPRVNGTAHPTVKPLDLMRWLVRLVTPPGGVVLEPFAGSGTTVEACILEGFRCIAIERETDYLPLIESRIARRRDPVKAIELSGEDGGLFDLLGEVGA